MQGSHTAFFQNFSPPITLNNDPPHNVKICCLPPSSFFCSSFTLWRRGVVVITTAQLHSTKPELKFCAGSNSARSVSEIRNGEDLWEWSWLKIRLHVFRRSTIPQKQFIIIIIIFLKLLWTVIMKRYTYRRDQTQ